MTVMTDSERNTLTIEVEKLMESFLEQSEILGKRLFILPLAKEDFRWLIHNPEKNLIGITGICPTVEAASPDKFCCIITNPKTAMHMQDEGFDLDSIIANPDAISVIPAKDILSRML